MTTTSPTTTRRITIYTDGLCEPRNPGGYACWGWVAFDADGRAFVHDWGCLGHGRNTTNNVSEYAALIFALDYAKSQGWRDILVRTDSKLVVEQVTGRWACNAPALQQHCTDARRLVALTRATLEWVPREQNAHADALSRRAYAEARRAAALSGRKVVLR